MKNIFLKQIIIGVIVCVLMGIINVKPVSAYSGYCVVNQYPQQWGYKTCWTGASVLNQNLCYTKNTWASYVCGECASYCLSLIPCTACGGMTVDQTCNKGSGNSECGVGYCSSQRSECCTSSNSVWGKYKVACINESDYLSGLSCKASWVTNGQTCSTGDKWVDHTWADGDPPDNFLYSSDCFCNRSASPYKYCCDAAGNPEYPTNGANVDGKGDWEADCPYGTETGNYGVNGDRIRSSPCGGGPIPTTPPSGCNCGNTDDKCWDVRYDNGCGDPFGCRGTGLNADSNCATKDSRCKKDGVYASNSCGTCTGTIETTTGASGVCGSGAETMHWNMNGTDPGSDYVKTQIISQHGSGGLCTDGSQPTPILNAVNSTYTWICGGGKGTCDGAYGSPVSCKAYWLNCNDLNYWTMYDDVKVAGWRPYLHYTTVHASEPGRIWPDIYAGDDGKTPFCWKDKDGKQIQITCGKTTAGIPGKNGSCGSSNGTMHWNMGVGTAPSTYNLINQINPGQTTSTNNLCGDGSKPTVNTKNDGTYTWTCGGGAGTCAADGNSTDCKAYWLNCNDLNYWAMYSDVPVFPLRPWPYYQLHPATTWPTSGLTPFCWSGNQITCGKATAGILGTNGVCGSSASKMFVTAPSTNLCSTTGAISWIDNIGVDGSFNWTCAGSVGTCAANGNPVNCSATRNLPPTFSSIVLKNNVGTAVVAESENVNQICQKEFNEVRTVNLTINATDVNGAGTISDIQLRWNGINFTRTGLANGVATFNHSFAAGENTTGAVDFQYYISDGVNTTGWKTAGRSLKVWDCNVSVRGTLYDGSAGIGCPTTGFSMPAMGIGFSSLLFTGGGNNISMTITPPNTYDGVGNKLTWGKTYTPSFNSNIGMLITTGGIKANTKCISWDINLADKEIVDPYTPSPTLVANFSGVVDQDGWYQAVGGGLMSNIGITNRVPVTCTDPVTCAMSIGKTGTSTATNGIVASPDISNTGNSNAKKGNPNDWLVTKPLVSTLKSDYTYFLNQYFWKSGIGTTLNVGTSMSVIGTNPTGVYFIKGDLTINANNSVPVGSFLMMVASGNINVDQSVTNLEGVFVSKNFNVGGSNATALSVKGMIKATENIKAYRTFIKKRTNNTTPAVNFVYRPDFVFNMPGAITKQLVKWQWGN